MIREIRMSHNLVVLVVRECITNQRGLKILPDILAKLASEGIQFLLYPDDRGM